MNDMTMLQVMVVGAAALAASTVAAITGTGGGILLLPLMTAIFGVRDAVPMYTVAQFIGNLSRVAFNRREILPGVVMWFALGAMPMAVIGGLLFVAAPDSILVRLLGAFLIFTVAWRRMREPRPHGFPIQRFALIGGAFGFISALVGSAGPFVAPFFLAFGLVKGAYIGTEALGTAVMHMTKLATYSSVSALSRTSIFLGLALGPIMVAGSFLGKRVIDRISRRTFTLVIDAVLVFSGVIFMVRG